MMADPKTAQKVAYLKCWTEDEHANASHATPRFLERGKDVTKRPTEPQQRRQRR